MAVGERRGEEAFVASHHQLVAHTAQAVYLGVVDSRFGYHGFLVVHDYVPEVGGQIGTLALRVECYVVYVLGGVQGRGGKARDYAQVAVVVQQGYGVVVMDNQQIASLRIICYVQYLVAFKIIGGVIARHFAALLIQDE